MGSWIGHIDEGIFFILISLWWCYKIFTNYIMVGCYVSSYSPRVSYPSKLCERELPLEIYFKILFPFAGFLGEFFSRGAVFIDEDGGFRKLVNLQHMTIYGAFVVHGLIDLADFYRAPVIQGSNYMSAAWAFFWYGYCFYFHASLENDKDPLENIVHLIPVPIMFFTSLAGVAELWLGEGHIWPQLVRSWGVLSLGTWFTQVAFVLYTPTQDPNPDWDQKDQRNVHASVAMLGTHLLLNLVVMMLMFTGIYLLMRFLGKTSSRLGYEYKSVKETETKADTLALLDNEV